MRTTFSTIKLTCICFNPITHEKIAEFENENDAIEFCKLNKCCYQFN